MARKLIDNERRACDAVVRALEARGGIKRAGAYSPEDEKIGPPVEYVFELRAQKHAVEHTNTRLLKLFPAKYGQIPTSLRSCPRLRRLCTETCRHQGNSI
jgi:hypothetical protein